MPLSNSRMAYEEEYKVMDKALEGGVRIGYKEKADAFSFRFRMNQARQLDREFNGERYARDHPMHHHSEYDALTFRVRKDKGMYWIYAERKVMGGVIEEITEETESEPIREVITVRRF